MEVILEIDTNESHVWQLVYQDLLLSCRLHRSEREKLRLEVNVNLRQWIIAAASSSDEVFSPKRNRLIY